MKNHQLDEKDKLIVNMLIKNARTSYTDIAKAVDLKSPTVIDRIKRLENDGFIKSYSADIDYKKFGYDILAFIGIFVDNAMNIERFEEELNQVNGDIIECHHVTGDYTMLIKVATKNTASLSSLIKEIRNLPGVQKTNTILVFSTIMDKAKPIVL